MKILHTSDWHLGRNDGDTSLYEDQVFFINEICRIAAEQRVDAVLIAGDVYDRAIASADASRLYDTAMTKLCIEVNIPVFIIAGNHDSAERLSTCSVLLRKSGLIICGELSRNIAPIELGNCEIFLLPWITEEKVKSVFPDDREQIENLTGAYFTVTEKMRALFSPDKRHIILSHAFITSAETSTSDRAAEIGFASQVSASVFDGFDYVALGHIHGPQKINERIRYCGTPMPYSFGKEEKQTKGVVILDTETMEQDFVPVKLLHKRTTIECTLQEALDPQCDDDVREGYTRLRISDSYVGLQMLSELRAVYAHPIDVEGKSFENETGTVTLTMKQLEEMKTDPAAIFRFYCQEEMGIEPDEHLAELFNKAVDDYEKEEKI